MVRRALVSLTLSVLALTAAACGDDGTKGAGTTGTGPVRVATSISVFADMLRQVGGDRVTIISLVPPGADAHTYQPGPKDVKQLADVRAVFLNGAGLEQSLGGVIQNNTPKTAKMVELSQGLTPITFEAEAVGPAGTDEEAEEAEGANPHFWLDVQNAKRYVERMRDALAD